MKNGFPGFLLLDLVNMSPTITCQEKLQTQQNEENQYLIFNREKEYRGKWEEENLITVPKYLHPFLSMALEDCRTT